MAVQVVDPTPDPSILKYTICGNCGVKLSYVPNDVKTGYDTDYTGSKDSYRYIICGACNKQTRIR